MRSHLADGVQDDECLGRGGQLGNHGTLVPAALPATATHFDIQKATPFYPLAIPTPLSWRGKNQIGPIRDEIGSFRNGRLALLWHLLMAGNDALAALPRRALQALCKQHGIKANGKVQYL